MPSWAYWKYALGLELTDPGFDFSVLSEFRARLTKAGERPQAPGGQPQAPGGAAGRESAGGQLLLDRMLHAFREKGLLKARGRQRTDSTHVLAAIRVMNRLELVTETLRAALNALAASAPDWLLAVAPAEWYTRYSLRAEDTRLPRRDKARQEYAQMAGNDGGALLRLVDEQRPDLGRLAAVGTLRQVWGRHFARSEAGEVLWRADADLARAATAVESPYDPEARHSNKRDISWTGYKVHLTETCDPDLPRLITDVHTTVATTQDVSCTASIQQSLADRDLLPQRHLVDWERKQATCPEGRASTVWGLFRTK